MKNSPCHYCGSVSGCRCTYRYMRKGKSGIEVYNTHPQTYADVSNTVNEILGHYPQDTPCVFKFSITRTKAEA